MELLSLGRDGIVRTGEILSVDQEANGSFGRVTLAGAVQLPGTRALGEVPTVARLIRQPSDLAPGAYTPLGILVHRDPATNFRHAVAFSLTRVFGGQEDVKLGEGDVVFVLSNDQARSLAAAAVAQLQSAAQAASVPPSVLSMALSASAAQATQTAAATAAAPAPAGIPTNNAAAIYAASNGSSSGSTPATSAGAAPSGTQPTSVGQAIATGVGQAVSGTLPLGTVGPVTGLPSPVAPPAGLMTSAPLPPVPPYQASVAAAASQQTPASIAMLQAENAQSAAAGIPLQGGGLTRLPALGVPAPDTVPTDIALELGLSPPALVSFAADYLVWVEGDVHDPGAYLAEGGSSLSAAIGAAGGLVLQADLSAIPVTSSDIAAASGPSPTLRTS
jgi:hypothetical protein